MVEPLEIKQYHLYELTSVSLPGNRHVTCKQKILSGASSEHSRQDGNKPMFTRLFEYGSDAFVCINVAALLPERK